MSKIKIKIKKIFWDDLYLAKLPEDSSDKQSLETSLLTIFSRTLHFFIKEILSLFTKAYGLKT